MIRNVKQRRKNQLLLTAIVGLMVVLWGVVLPRLADHPVIQERASFQEAHGIEPAAMFYSDSPAAGMAEERLERFRKENPGAFWKP